MSLLLSSGRPMVSDRLQLLPVTAGMPMIFDTGSGSFSSSGIIMALERGVPSSHSFTGSGSGMPEATGSWDSRMLVATAPEPKGACTVTSACPAATPLA